MSREVCGVCWCPYDEETGECACAPPVTPNCSNCASLQEQNTELDRKLAEMEAKLNNQSVDDAFRILAEANRRAIDYINQLERQINEYKQTLALQQRSYEREIQIEVEAERQRCADIADQHAGIEGVAQKIAAEIRGQQ